MSVVRPKGGPAMPRANGASSPNGKSHPQPAGTTRPSVVRGSGGGVHLSWLLAEPDRIDDAGDPPPVEAEWSDVTDPATGRPVINPDTGKPRRRARRWCVNPATGDDLPESRF